MTDVPLLSARGVTKIYRTGAVEVTALDHLDLDVHAGELVAVMGPSGSGKTTLLNCLSGLDDIDAGRVVVDGRDLFAMKDSDRTEHRARTMGFVFQAFNLIPVFSAAENVELPLLLVGTPPAVARRTALEMLDRVGLGHRGEHRPNEMSGGEQQRVTIARALVGRPAVVWADEPTGNLDTKMAAQVMDLLRELNETDQQTIVLVTHDPTIGASARRIVRMRDGRLDADEHAAGRVSHTRTVASGGQRGASQGGGAADSGVLSAATTTPRGAVLSAAQQVMGAGDTPSAGAGTR